MKKKLNLTVVLRSHDCYGAYPLNLAAVCRWLCEEAEALNMEVGTVTCVSMSAHVYDHALEAAAAVVAEHVKPGAWSQDPRSAWRVWRGNVWSEPRPGSWVRERHGDGGFVCEVCQEHTPFAVDPPAMCPECGNPGEGVFTPTYHAEATDPEGTRVLQLFEAPAKERLVKDIQASGLVSSVQHALWLGAEVGRL